MRVPLGRSNRLVAGYCVRLEDRAVGRRRLKPIHDVLDQRSLLSPAMVRLTQWMAEHYLCDWAAVLDAVVPAGVRVGAGTRMATLLTVDPEAASRIGELKSTNKQVEILKILAAAKEPLTPADLRDWPDALRRRSPPCAAKA